MKKQSDIDKFEKVEAQLNALHKELGVLSKKKPDDGINPFKLKLVNSVLEKANELLEKKYKPFSDFELFDLDDVPTNSDVVTILAQYLNCMEELRSDNIKTCAGDWVWYIGNNKTAIRTAPPKKLTER